MKVNPLKLRLLCLYPFLILTVNWLLMFSTCRIKKIYMSQRSSELSVKTAQVAVCPLSALYQMSI